MVLVILAGAGQPHSRVWWLASQLVLLGDLACMSGGWCSASWSDDHISLMQQVSLGSYTRWLLQDSVEQKGQSPVRKPLLVLFADVHWPKEVKWPNPHSLHYDRTGAVMMLRSEHTYLRRIFGHLQLPHLSQFFYHLHFVQIFIRLQGNKKASKTGVLCVKE